MGSAERIASACRPFGISAREAMGTLGLLAVLWITIPDAKALADESKLGTAPRMQLDRGHPWRPPFGLDRVGGPLGVLVESPAGTPLAAGLTVVGYRDGQELARLEVVLQGQSTAARVQFEVWPSEVVLLAPAENGRREELARQSVQAPTLEAEAIARPDVAIAPIDLGAILVPSDWLLLADGQVAVVELAAISHQEDLPAARVVAGFESSPQATCSSELPLVHGVPARVRLPLVEDASANPLPLPGAAATLDRDTLCVTIQAADGSTLWQKKIPTILAHERSAWPRFGATRAKLRYHAPISVRADDGSFSSMRFEDGWDPSLEDIVISLPNGSRFVFWRGSCYVPFWAGRCNTGLSYEWAETSPPADGFEDCVEPLMDKELRYGRVEVVESTSARVHVRWSYQSCDFKYKVWGDSAVEDYVFYPDGFGTRTLTIQRAATSDYELSEFIILTPQSTYPLSVLPPNLVDVLFADGEKQELRFPFHTAQQRDAFYAAEQGDEARNHKLPAIYRVRLHKDEPLAAVYFNPHDMHLPPAIFAPFYDQGVLVTPTYWGSHWPLARGKTTGWAIDDRVHFTPCHNSVMSWARSRPAPIRSSQGDMRDTLGQVKPMIAETWVWLIGMSDADDERLLSWARSFSHPPLLELHGAHLDSEPNCPERRATRLIVDERTVTGTIHPQPVCVNPVFEFSNGSATLLRVELSGAPLAAERYAWDGRTLWLDVSLTEPTALRLEFGPAPQ